MTVPAEISRGLLTGVVAGFASGLLGVSPGGILVPVISLTLGFPQHLAQAVSLVAQAPPTGLAGISNYAKSWRGTPHSWIVLLSCGFIAGGLAGADLSRLLTDRESRWIFVAYLLLLALLSAASRTQPEITSSDLSQTPRAPWGMLILIGFGAGISSGFLGIGGGLAITAFSVLLLHLNQHRAQALSLMVTALPLTLPAAWMYVRQGVHLPWLATAGIVLGLALGNKLGAILANRLPERSLRFVFSALIVAMAIYMAVSA